MHKYKNWSQELKSSYDYYPELKMVVTGSSALDIYKGKVDLSRRAILYRLNGLSFREYIEFKYGISFPVLTLDEVFENPSKPIFTILEAVKPIKLFEEYIRWGYYPFFTEGLPEYPVRIKQIVNHVLDVDLPSVENIDFNAVHYLRILLSMLSELVPFKPNIVKLSHQVGISRETLVRYLYLLERADLIMLLQTATKGNSKMNKPDKIYLNNTNLFYALSPGQANAGSIRETFFFNQTRFKHDVRNAQSGDFLIDGKFTVEVGGSNKPQKQVRGIENAYMAVDNTEYAHQNRIPLWLFGFLY